MHIQTRAAGLPLSSLLVAVLAVSGLVAPARHAFAAECRIIHQGAPSPAEQAYLASDYAKAEALYRNALKAAPDNTKLMEGFVHTLLSDQKVQQASDAVQAALARTPRSAALITLRGEVEFREGELAKAADSVDESIKLDLCNPRTHLLLYYLAETSSMSALANREILIAHSLDPDDPDIRGEWIMTLPRKERVAELEAFLSKPNGVDPDDLRYLHQYLNFQKKLMVEPQKTCRLVSSTSYAQMSLHPITTDNGLEQIMGFGLDVKFNGHKAQLQVDTGSSGLFVSSAVAKRAGLKAFAQESVGGVGDQGEKSGYMAYADSIQIGNLKFKNCRVDVEDSRHVAGSEEGLIGMDVFSHFLVTLDFPMFKLRLAPLPPRPGEEPHAAVLNTSGLRQDDSEATPAGKETAAHPDTQGPYDRYIAPSMRDYTRTYRWGDDLILPVRLDKGESVLFLLDTGSSDNTISPQAASKVTKVVRDRAGDVQGISGWVNKVYSTGNVTFHFAGLAQKAETVLSIDTSKFSDSAGMEISGFLGINTLDKLTMRIDYRDGLVKFDYDPTRGHRF